MHAGQATDGSSTPPSYVSGGSTTPLLGMTIGDCFDATVRARPDRLALVVRSRGIRWTYRELAAAVDRFASGPASLGLVAGSAQVAPSSILRSASRAARRRGSCGKRLQPPFTADASATPRFEFCRRAPKWLPL
jgi:hypothetical protein